MMTQVQSKSISQMLTFGIIQKWFVNLTHHLLQAREKCLVPTIF